MIRSLFIALTFLFASPVFSQSEDSTTLFCIGETHTFHSEILNESRTINVYLPDSYSKDSLKKYPVIYLLDGSREEDFIHISGLVQFGSFSWINMIPETIVIGISNVDRKRDFTFPTTIKKDQKRYPTSGGSNRFIQFLELELQPLVENRYHTTAEKTLIGQSLGGLLATEVLIKKPHLFTNYIIVSPSIWWDNQSLLNASLEKCKEMKSVYVAVGKEGKIMERDAKKIYEKLMLQEENQVYFHFFEGQNHGDALHLAVYDAFETIFKKQK